MSTKLTPAAIARLQQERDNFWIALHVIAQYLPPEKLQIHGQRLYGLQPEEAIEYAYENVLGLAKTTIKGTRKPKD